jgi:MoaA/NifB/PqqE/SkfB family radical SAM enzyme
MVFLLLTGGEVFLRPDFFDIYKPLTGMGLILTLFTNGTLITEEVAARLAETPASRTEITLYGATASTYETVTGVPGSYERCRAGIERLIRRRVPLALKTAITRHNVGELAAMQQMAGDWGLPFSTGWLLSKRPDGVPSDVEECRLSPLDCASLAANCGSADEWTEAALRESSAGSDRSFACLAGLSGFAVNPMGEMNACLEFTLPATRPLEIGFSTAWKEVQRFVDGAPPPAPVCL